VLDRLHGGERQLTLLALEAGFGSYNRFHAVFRAQMGMSPREYLALHLLDEESALRSRSPKKRKAE
jgi:AraC-like DNA-binding protein